MTARELLIRILTRSEGKGIGQAKAGIHEVKKEAGSLKESLQSALGNMGGLGRMISGAMNLALGPIGAITAGLGLLAAGIRAATGALREFASQEVAEVRIVAALKQMGQYTDAYRDKLTALAGKLQETTGVGDETWLAMMGQLTRFGMSSGNVDRVTSAVVNLAGVLQGGTIEGRVQTATMLIQRALEGNFEMFTRYGIRLEKTGDQAQDLANLFKLLAEKGAGALTAEVDTLSGQSKALGNAWTDLRQEIGRIIADFTHAKDVIGSVSQAVDWLKGKVASSKESFSGWGGAINAVLPNSLKLVKALGDVIAGLRRPTQDAGEEVQELGQAVEGIGDADLSGAVASADDLADSLKRAADEAERAQKHMEAMASAELGVKLAEVDVAVAEGKMTREQGELAKTKLRGAYEEEKYQRAKTAAGSPEELALIEMQHREATLGTRAKTIRAERDIKEAEARKKEPLIQAEVERLKGQRETLQQQSESGFPADEATVRRERIEARAAGSAAAAARGKGGSLAGIRAAEETARREERELAAATERLARLQRGVMDGIESLNKSIAEAEGRLKNLPIYR